ncbi:hypothetical protein ZIOFF_031376 [Zingiber officinale]|uniref:Uncharacterized protein n=1 Tax=Zingiber officinale TaxID=94328 RepID=A0A8J5LAQ5_ZINOF|nr:hypothetical protein ZIOFF_031376 [Zingiber officinale]
MTGNERRSEAESSPATAAVARAGNVGADVVPAEEKGACVVIDVGRCSGKEADEDGGDRKGESECRICQLSLSSGGEGSELISGAAARASSASHTATVLRLGFRSRATGDIFMTLSPWFGSYLLTKRGSFFQGREETSRCCEICGAIAKNITVVVDSRVSEEGPSRGESNTRSPSDTGERIVCWRRLPVCNLLMACLIIAFILLWFFRVSMF